RRLSGGLLAVRLARLRILGLGRRLGLRGALGQSGLGVLLRARLLVVGLRRVLGILDVVSEVAADQGDHSIQPFDLFLDLLALDHQAVQPHPGRFLPSFGLGGACDDAGRAGVGHADALEAVGQVFALAGGLVQCLQPQSRALFTGDVDVVAVLVGDQVRAVQPADGLDQRSHGVVLLLRVGVSSGVVGEVCVWRDGDGDTSAQGRIMATAATVTYRLRATHRAHSWVPPALPRIGTATSPSACHSGEEARSEGFSTSGQVGKGIPSVVSRSPSRCTSAPSPIAAGSQIDASGARKPTSSPAPAPISQGAREPVVSFSARTAKAHSTATTAVVAISTCPTTGACTAQSRRATKTPASVKTATASRVWVAPR